MAAEKPKTITIDDVRYVREDSVKSEQKAESLDGLEIVLVRSPAAGVFVGSLASREERVVKLLNCRRLWYWNGAFTLSQLARDGVSKPKDCKFSCCVDEHIILDTVEIIPMTKRAADCVYSVNPTEA